MIGRNDFDAGRKNGIVANIDSIICLKIAISTTGKRMSNIFPDFDFGDLYSYDISSLFGPVEEKLSPVQRAVFLA